MSFDFIWKSLTPSAVLEGVRLGIFPWYQDPDDPTWHCPDERCVFFTDVYKPSKSLLQAARKMAWTVTIDQAFGEVIRNCAGNGREHETWIFPEIIETYSTLHEMGYAHSVEVWREGILVGGLYGLSMGRIFTGESMFSIEPNTSKFALYHLMVHAKRKGFVCVDAQVPNPHLLSLGASVITQSEYMDILNASLAFPDQLGQDFISI